MSKRNLSGGGRRSTSLSPPQQGPRRDPPQPSGGSRGKGSGRRPSPSPFQKDPRQDREALDAERLSYQEARCHFAIEVREIREGAKRDRQLLEDKLRSKAEQQLARQLQQLREETTRQRETEIRLLLRWKEAELREAQEFLKQERDAAMRQARDLQRQLAKELVSHGSSRATLEEVLGKLRWEADGEQATRIRHLEAELELERRLFLQYILEHFEGEPLPAGPLHRFRQTSSPPDGKVNSWGAAGEHPPEGLPQPGGLSGSPCDQLRKQNADLLISLQILEGKRTHLEEENALLRKSSFPDMQDRVKILKRKGAELAAITMQLEATAGKLQEFDPGVNNAPGPLALNCSEGEFCEKAFAQQKAKDLNERACVLLAKDRQIEALQKERRELQAMLSSGKENHSSYSIRDLALFLRESQKEVLRLQRQIALRSQRDSLQAPSRIVANDSSSGIIQKPSATTHVGLEDSSLAKKKPKTPNILKVDGESQARTFSNEAKNRKNSLKRDSKNESHLQLLGKQLAEKQRQCDHLVLEIEEKQKRWNKGDLKLHEISRENAQLSEENVRLRGRNKRAKKTANEKADLRVKMIQATNERNSAVQLAQGREVKAENLEQVLETMKERAERRQQLENEPEKTEPELKKKDEAESLEQAPTEITRERDEGQFFETQAKELDNLYPSQMERVNFLNPEGTTGELEEWETEKVSLELQSDNPRPFRLRCFLARYSYDPFNGPNKNPEGELPLTAGQYVYICGEMNEDGFYLGELTDGRRGFVPSNLVEEVEGHDLENCGAISLSPEPSLYSLDGELRKGTDEGVQNVCFQDIFREKGQGKLIKQLLRKLSKLTVSPPEAQEDKAFRRGSWQVSVGDYSHHFDLSGIEEEDQESQWYMSDEEVYKTQEKPESYTEVAKEKIRMTILRADPISNSGPPTNVASVNSDTSRLFVALGDYDPTVMSPNSDADEELPFQGGQILKVTGDKVAEGFYRGECERKEGLIPCNVVSEIHADHMEDVTSHGDV